ncbi:interferon-induced transmembrane protein 10-like isoform X2 [Hyla sarda]|uniref:interferon-induced transmembrane protein 10-like isoform X2 n=1 Tax=Hyla sarda TaxID=327740 RepID=UPI0024C39D6A|nr:interferon-induced transmembrane protein 10-like isoform X2 [Hyla sarda]
MYKLLCRLPTELLLRPDYATVPPALTYCYPDYELPHPSCASHLLSHLCGRAVPGVATCVSPAAASPSCFAAGSGEDQRHLRLHSLVRSESSATQVQRIRIHRSSCLQKPPRDHLLWSLCNTVYLNLFCLGFMALVYSVKARDQKVHGNELAARRYGRKARCYNILATIWNIALPAFILALVITGIVHLSQVVNASLDFFNLQSFMGNTDDDSN